ncbi:Acetylornithine deacetylase [Arachis hypogaea]|nr:Acetylornithine deacetylase [Arachis hypogaea]
MWYVCALPPAAWQLDQAINPLELSMDALKKIQSRFYEDFSPHPQEQIYGFATASTMKPTQWSYPRGGINQISGECTISGDVRLTPFYNLTLTFDEANFGVACDLNFRGYDVLCKATEEVVGHVKPYSITGSLPLIWELQDEGFDVQTAGYGLMATYHA